MRSIQSNFNSIKRSNPCWADYVCLAEAVKSKHFTRRRIYTSFIKLVSKDDYKLSDTNRLVRHLYLLTNMPEECTFSSKIEPETSQNRVNEQAHTYHQKELIMV